MQWLPSVTTAFFNGISISSKLLKTFIGPAFGSQIALDTHDESVYLMHLLHEINLLRLHANCAEVAELVDALGSGSSEGSLVGVRVSPSAPQ